VNGPGSSAVKTPGGGGIIRHGCPSRLLRVKSRALTTCICGAGIERAKSKEPARCRRYEGPTHSAAWYECKRDCGRSGGFIAERAVKSKESARTPFDCAQDEPALRKARLRPAVPRPRGSLHARVLNQKQDAGLKPGATKAKAAGVTKGRHIRLLGTASGASAIEIAALRKANPAFRWT
jgi:hypothetical protein